LLDAGICDDWPSEVREALERFRLGNLISEPPFFFVRNPAFALWTPPAGSFDSDAELVELPREQRPPYGIITTQTCDLNEQRTYPVQPCFQVSPVYRLDIERGFQDPALERQYFHQLTSPELGEKLCVADLRIEMPLEKSTLVGREPIQAFEDEQDEVDFAEKLGRRRDRAALGNAINEVLDRTMRDRISANKNRARRVFASVMKLGLAITDGPRLQPLAAQLHIMTTIATPSVVTAGAEGPLEELHEWFEAWWDRANVAGEQHDPKLRLLANVYHDGHAMDLSIHDSLIPFERRP
jgi:hypothetical protein